jgi:hypothetical protein
MTVALQPGKLVLIFAVELGLSCHRKILTCWLSNRLVGRDEEIAGIYLPLGLESDQPTDASFTPPTKDDLGDISTARLLYDSARLAFRNGAGPFRSLAKLSFRPRSYQMVPLIMALRQESVRLHPYRG